MRISLFSGDLCDVEAEALCTSTNPRLSLAMGTGGSVRSRGGYEILDHCRQKLGIGHKQVTPDGTFSLEEVECIGACCWAPAMQVNYDFHEELTPEKVDTILAEYAAGAGKDVK